MNSESIRRAFIEYFRERGHLQLPSLSLVPADPSVTTLFTIAGMQQMIGFFLGREDPPSRRLITVQKAIRTVDIEEVGDDSHLTFLEMLGNFSVGDYFKKEAIGFTWEFLTQIMGVPPARWWATIYPGDEEARSAWVAAGIPLDRIGETEENWWAQGPVGPCGPDSEIHFDRGAEYSCGHANCRPESECCDRFLETWNNVFMVYFQDESGERRPLPWNNIDTGMGFERLVTIVQGKKSPYETDLFLPIIDRIVASGVQDIGQDPTGNPSIRIIADHCRAIAFIVADGVMPAAEGRGYVLRRLLRRAALHGRLLGIDREFLAEPIEAVVDNLGGYWTELVDRRAHVLHVVQQEERRFRQTLSRGLGRFEDAALHAEKNGGMVSGADAFLLHDTYGFPLELTSELAQRRGLSVDRDGFRVELGRQQERGRADRKQEGAVTTPPQVYTDIAERNGPVVFTGYDELQTPSEIAAIIAGGKEATRADKGDRVELILTRTPFYAESGGQVGDTGYIRGDNGVARIVDTQRPHVGVIVHSAEVEDGSLNVGDAVLAEVDTERRLHILPHHSGTHLLHKALQEVLGPEAVQAGSLVAPDHLRFDFRWARPVTTDELREIQDRVNAAIWANLPVTKEVMPYDQAIATGAMALFGEKYGDRVRVVSMGEWSKELCGGTHVNATGDIGLLLITGETGIGSGIRRIEALAGAAAYAYVNDLREYLDAAARAMDTKTENLVVRARQVSSEVRELQKRIEALTQKLAAREAEALVRQGIAVNGFTVVADEISADSDDLLKATTDAVKARLGRGVVVLGSIVDGSPKFAMAITPDVQEKGLKANDLLRQAARQASGGAGGNAGFAQGGGKDPSRLGIVLQTAVELVKRQAES